MAGSYMQNWKWKRTFKGVRWKGLTLDICRLPEIFDVIDFNIVFGKDTWKVYVMIIFNHLYLYPPLFLYVMIWREVRISLWVFSITMFLWLESDTPFIGNVLNENIEVEVEFWEFVYELCYRFFNSKIKDYFEKTANPRCDWNIKRLDDYY